MALDTEKKAYEEKEKNKATGSTPPIGGYSVPTPSYGISQEYYNTIKSKMDENSAAWHNANPDEQKVLEAQNQVYGQALGMSYDPHTGTWSGGYPIVQQPATNLQSYMSTNPYAQTQSQINSLLSKQRTQKIQEANTNFDRLAQQAYIQKMQEQANVPTNLAAAGIKGGLSETAVIAPGIAYGNNLSNIENSRADALNQINMATDEQQLQYAYDIADRIIQQANADRSFAYGAYRDTIADNRYENEFSYNVGRDQISDRERAMNNALNVAGATGDYSVMKEYGWTDNQIRAANNQFALSNAPRSSGSRSSGSGRSSGGSEPDASIVSQIPSGLTAAQAREWLINNGVSTQWKVNAYLDSYLESQGITSPTNYSSSEQQWAANLAEDGTINNDTLPILRSMYPNLSDDMIYSMYDLQRPAGPGNGNIQYTYDQMRSIIQSTLNPDASNNTPPAYALAQAYDTLVGYAENGWIDDATLNRLVREFNL